jgi:hypothetical protein
MITDPLLANRPLPPFHIRSAPYDYPGQDNGNARMAPDAQVGVLSMSGKAGRVVRYIVLRPADPGRELG